MTEGFGLESLKNRKQLNEVLNSYETKRCVQRVKAEKEQKKRVREHISELDNNGNNPKTIDALVEFVKGIEVIKGEDKALEDAEGNQATLAMAAADKAAADAATVKAAKTAVDAAAWCKGVSQDKLDTLSATLFTIAKETGMGVSHRELDALFMTLIGIAKETDKKYSLNKTADIRSVHTGLLKADPLLTGSQYLPTNATCIAGNLCLHGIGAVLAASSSLIVSFQVL